jgi:mercuric ion binding protein
MLTGIMTLNMFGLCGLSAETQGMHTVILQIDSMTCGACVKDVKAALNKVPGVSAVEVRVGKKWIVFSAIMRTRAPR